jgi:L-asparagine oxygenase
MTSTADAAILLTPTESAYVRQSLERIDYDPAGGAAYIRDVRRMAYEAFPDRIIQALELMKAPNDSALSAVTIDNLPIDERVTGSPHFEETGASFKSGVLSENVLIALGAILGEPYSIAHEGREIVNNLTPHKDNAKDYTGLGSDVELDFHIENAALAHMPEGDTSPMALLLLGVRGEQGTGPCTRLADARHALRLLSDEDIEILSGRNFVLRVPYRWRSVAPQMRENTDLVAVMSGPLDTPRITVAFYPDMILAVNARAKAALDNLYRAVREISCGIQLVPGKLIAINNYFTLHSRDRFKPEYDENDRAHRWVQRVFVAHSLWNFRIYTPVHGRVFGAKQR